MEGNNSKTHAQFSTNQATKLTSNQRLLVVSVFTKKMFSKVLDFQSLYIQAQNRLIA